MVIFSNAKINIGLNIVSKRPDGFHNIESIFYPIPWFDVIEILPSNTFELQVFGLPIACSTEKNLCFKAFQLMKELFNIPPVQLILYKNIPDGAGLGGGSANATYTLIGLNKLFKLNIPPQTLMEIAYKIGSDCTFFVQNIPSFVEGKGNLLTPVNIDLSDYYLVVLKNHLKVSTAWAYSQIVPQQPHLKINQLVNNFPVSEWKYHLKNDFEEVIFKLHPELANIKDWLYENGAVYASMTGSGSAIYGLFQEEPTLTLTQFPFYWKGKLTSFADGNRE